MTPILTSRSRCGNSCLMQECQITSNKNKWRKCLVVTVSWFVCLPVSFFPKLNSCTVDTMQIWNVSPHFEEPSFSIAWNMNAAWWNSPKTHFVWSYHGFQMSPVSSQQCFEIRDRESVERSRNHLSHNGPQWKLWDLGASAKRAWSMGASA